MEKEAAQGVTARNVGVLATPDSFAPTVRIKKDIKWMMFVHLTRTISGSHSG
jgi:hypothetical protein